MASNSPKFRDYFITINEGAPCYGEALEIVNSKLNKKCWAAIYHDKDKVIDEEGNAKPKKKHLHIVIELKNPVSFESMRTKFEGAHIETIKYKKSAYQYLLHNSPMSHEKYQYAFEEIITDHPEAVKATIESETFELFKENLFLRYIAEGIVTPYQFTKRFGLNAYRQYWKPYADMLTCLKDDPEMQRDLKDEIELLNKDEDRHMPF